MMIGIRRVYKSVAVIGCAHESVAVILRRALNTEAKYLVGSGSSGEGQNQKVEASGNEPNIAGDLTKTRNKWYGYHRPGTSLEDIAKRLGKARKAGRKFVYARDPCAVEMDVFTAAQKLQEMEDAMPKLTPAERKLGLGPCEVCGKEKDHTTDECPYLEIIPKGEEGNVCEMYAVVCKGCGMEGGHPGKSWTGCAVLKCCSRCFVVGDHLYANCPNLEPEKRERLRQIKVKHHRLGINF